MPRSPCRKNDRHHTVPLVTPPARSVLLIVAVAALTFIAGLGRAAITDADEAFYAEASREMVESGDWLSPRYNYEDRWQKPVLYYWAAALAYVAAGVGEAPARFPAALSGLGLALLAWWCARRWYDERTGRLAGVIIATSAGCAALARQSLPDLPLAFFITWSIVAAFAWLFESDTPRLGRLLVSAAASGAAFLTKGPLGVVIPAIVIGPLLMIEGRWRRIRVSHLLLAAVVWLAVAAPWYVAMWRVHGTPYLESFFIADNLERFATDRFNEPRPVWFYGPIILAGLLPWSAFLLLWVPSAWNLLKGRLRVSTVDLRLLVWAGLPLLLFTASVGKQPRYILPILPPLAVALAATLTRRLTAHGAPDTLVRAAGALTAVVHLVVGGVLIALPARPIGISEVVLSSAGVLVIVAGLAVGLVAWWRARALPVVVAAAGVVLMLSLQYGLLSTPHPETVQLVADRIRAELRPGMAWTTHDVFGRNLVFYVRQPQAGPFTDEELVAFLAGPGPVLAVLSEDDLERLVPHLRAPLHRLESWRYFNVAGIRARIVIDPDPEGEIRTAVLVSNQGPARR
jgi:4-amino-4-deoxy-L-arabinose transferase-like glycosyltransferase